MSRRKQTNEVRIRPDGIVQVQLTQGMVALVDVEDWKMVRAYKWCTLRSPHTCYAMTTGGIKHGRKYLYMHRLIANAPNGTDVDHKNGNGLDNRRSNLRLATRSQNLANRKKGGGTSRYKGVYYYKARGKWHTQLTCRGRRIFLGYFDREGDAARAYNEAAKKHFGKYARLNNVSGHNE